jgi:hypothetical protein
MRNAYKTLVGKPEGKRPLVTHRQRWETNGNMELNKKRVLVYRLDPSGSG